MRFRTIGLAALLILVLGPWTVLAQPSQADIDASKKAAAELANKALGAFKDGKYQDAIDGFQKADEKFHAPKFILYVARARAKLGRLLAAKATYEAILEEQFPAFAPVEFFRAQADAKTDLGELTPRIPTLTVQARGGIASVKLDGHAIGTDKAILVDPGEHMLVGNGGSPEVRVTLTLQEREARIVVLEPPAPPVPTASATASGVSTASGAGSSTAIAGTKQASTTTPSAEPIPSKGGVPTLTFVAYGVGAAGLVAGAVFGGLTLAKHNEYDEKPTREALDQGRTFGLITDIGFGTAIAGAAVGTIYWLVARPKSDPSPPKAGAFIAPTAGSRGAGVTLSGRF